MGLLCSIAGIVFATIIAANVCIKRATDIVNAFNGTVANATKFINSVRHLIMLLRQLKHSFHLLVETVRGHKSKK